MAPSLPDGVRQWLRRVSQARARSVRIRSGHAMRVDAAASMGENGLRMSAPIGGSPRMHADAPADQSLLRHVFKDADRFEATCQPGACRRIRPPASAARQGLSDLSLLVNQSCIM
ncbi:hypothetical protein [Methyloversatilis discipulorum]|uniref:hypothetical protein n=1 Tax=Methyloversatilis discipulorum TaxID=1119528 RepID=UPI0031383571